MSPKSRTQARCPLSLATSKGSGWLEGHSLRHSMFDEGQATLQSAQRVTVSYAAANLSQRYRSHVNVQFPQTCAPCDYTASPQAICRPVVCTKNGKNPVSTSAMKRSSPVEGSGQVRVRVRVRQEGCLQNSAWLNSVRK